MAELFNKSAEASIVSILLRETQQNVIEILQKIDPKDFGYKYENIPIYGNLVYLIEKVIAKQDNNDKITPGMLLSEVENYKKLHKALGGDSALETITSLANVEFAGEDADYYIDEIKKYSAARKVIDQADHVKQKITNEACKMSYNEVIAVVESIKIENAKDSLLSGGHISENSESYLEVSESCKNGIIGVPSRWDILNKLNYGYQQQTLTVWSSYTNGGKSIVLINEADHIANNEKIPTLYIDTEMVAKQVYPRLLSLRCGHASQGDPNLMISTRDIKLGTFQNNKTKVAFIKDQIQKIKEGSLYFVPVDSFDEDSLINTVRYYIMKHGIELIIFDYLKMPRIAAKSGLNETQMLGNLVETVKNGIAKRFNKPIISACQTDQHQKDRIADSARIMRFSDMVLNWRKKEDIATHIYGTHEAYIQKSREDIKDVGINFSFIGSTSGIELGVNSHLRIGD